MSSAQRLYDVVKVRSASGTYTTSIVRGFRASCTVGAFEAVDRLGQKLYGRHALFGVRPAPEPNHDVGCEVFHLFAPEVHCAP